MTRLVAVLALILAGSTPRPVDVIPAGPVAGTSEPDHRRTERPTPPGHSPDAHRRVSGRWAAVPGKRPGPYASVSGTSTWYCEPGRSRCTRGYGPECLCAAAGSELRAALGPDWRGRIVTVTAGTRSVAVTLVDTCLCRGERILDLYAAAFRALGPLSRGVMAVTVTW